MQNGDSTGELHIHLPNDVCCSLGVVCAVASAASTVVGMLLQKAGIKREDKVLFYLGVLIFTAVKPVTQIAALFFAPISLIAPLASVSILLNAAIVPYFEEEKLRCWDVMAGAILMLGCIGTTSAGAHNAQRWSYAQLITLGIDSIWLTSTLFIVVISLSLVLLVAKRTSKGKELSIVAVALIPSTASALNNVMLKVLLQAVPSAPWPSLLPIVISVGGTAFLQVWSTTIGVQLFDMLVFVPVQIALQIFVTTAYGLVFFQEVPAEPYIFTICAGGIVTGVLMTQVKSKGRKEPLSTIEVIDGYAALEDGTEGKKESETERSTSVDTAPEVCKKSPSFDSADSDYSKIRGA